MKRIMTIILVVLMMMSVTACTSVHATPDAKEPAQETPQVVDAKRDANDTEVPPETTQEPVQASAEVTMSDEETLPVENTEKAAFTKEHVAYLRANEEYSFGLNEQMTYQTAAEMFYDLLANPNPLEKDVENAEMRIMTDLGVFGEHAADDAISRHDFEKALKVFVDIEVSESDNEETFTKLNAIKITNAALGRTPDENAINDISRYWWRDMPENDADYLQVMEAAITHDVTEEGEMEIWSNPVIPESRFKSGYTSGSLYLDQMLADIIGEVTSDEMSAEENLHELYRYVRDNFNYQKKPLHSVNDMDEWLTPTVVEALETKRGNCYCYAGTLYSLFRAYGFDCEMCVGKFTGRPHGWVEAEIDGTRYIYDVEIEWCSLHPNWYPDKYVNMFKLDLATAPQWEYVREMPDNQQVAEEQTP